MTEFNPTDVRFIKLGEKGRWEKPCIDDGTIRLGYQSGQHLASLEGRWDEVSESWGRGAAAGVAKRHVNQIRDFYELPASSLWITIYDRFLYWCFADHEVCERSDDKSRVRRAINGWSSKDLNGRDLHIENIDGRITQVQGFRGTICKVMLHDYLFRKIRGEIMPGAIATEKAFDDLRAKVADLIQGLWWHDFELLAEIIFARAGWQRTSVMGKTEKDIDIDLHAPLTGRRAFVQVKSKADLAICEASTKEKAGYEEMYFVVHTPSDDLIQWAAPKNVYVLTGLKLAEHTINAGLSRWLLSKCG